MSKILRVLVTIMGAFILLGLLAIIGFVVFVNPNDLKPQISQAVNKYTGRQLQLAGNIEWSLYPWLGLQLNDTKLSNTPGFGDKPFAQIKKLDIQVRLLPLLHKQLEIGKLRVNGLILYLVKNAQGRTNWQGPFTQAASTTTTPTPASSSAVPDSLKPLGFVVAGIDIQNGQLFFDDQQKNKHYEVSELQLKSANLRFNQSSPFSIEFNLRSNAPKLNATVKLTTQLTLSLNSKKITLNKLKLDTLLRDSTYPKGELPLSLQGDATLNLSDQTFASDKFTLTIAQTKFAGRMAGEHVTNHPSLSGVLSTEQLKSGKFTIQQLQLPFQFKNNILALKTMTGKLYQGNYQGDLSVDLTTPTPQFVTLGQLTQINTLALFQELNSKSQIKLAGLANIHFKLATRGSTPNTLIKNLQGQGQFNLDHGAIKGINLSYWVARGKALLKHETKPTDNASDTPFTKFMGSFTIDKGILTNNDLAVSSGRLHIHGKGFIDLPQQQINYELEAQPVLADSSPDGIAIPIKITGQFSNIHIAPLLDKLSIDIVKEKLKGKLQEQLKKLDLKKIFQ